jgi:hypothetical protein
MPLSRRTLLGSAAGVAGAATLEVLSPSPASAGTGRKSGPPVVISATPDTYQQNLFNAYSNSGVGWTGADSTYSARLPGGREMWIFSDTLIGPVNPDGTRPRDAQFLNNSLVIQRGRRLSTVTGGTPQARTNIFQPETPGNWYWVGSGIVTGQVWQQIVIEFTRTGSGSFDFAYANSKLARVRIDRLNHPIDYTALPSQAPTKSFAAWVQRFGPFTYIYGVEDLGLVKYMHIARVSGDDLRRPWSFWTGGGWSASVADSTRVMANISNEYSVTPWRGRYLLITHDTAELFSSHIVAYVADTPVGPFTDKTTIYTTPETGLLGSYGNANVITYNSHLHPELSTDRRLLITYNVNTLDPNLLYEDVSVYRPRFIDVVFAQ